MKWIMIIMIGIMKGIMECDKAQKKALKRQKLLMFLKLLPFQGEGGKTPYSLILLYTAPGSGRLHSWR